MMIQARVKPGSTKPGIEKNEDHWLIRVRERAMDGKANAAVIAAIAADLKVSRKLVTISHGQNSRIKTIEVRE